MRVPRYYQEEGVTAVFDYFAAGNTGHPLVVLPTGTGKSLVIAEILRRACTLWPGTRCMMITHVKELIEQNSKTLLDNWPTAPLGIYSSGLGERNVIAPIIFAGIQSVYKIARRIGHMDLIFIDEAHLVNPKETTMYMAFILEMMAINPCLKIIGLTATPYRVGQGMLTDAGGIFTDTVLDYSSMEKFNQLLREGYLCRLQPKPAGVDMDLSDVKVQKGEYNLKGLQAAVDRDEITMAALKECREQGHDRNHWLIFTTGVEHTLHVTTMLDSLGVPATCVHSKMKAAERDKNIADFKAGYYRAIVNNNVLTTGFDAPFIDLIGVLRPTKSPGLWVQMLGRGTRPFYAPGYDLGTVEGRQAAIANSAKPNCLVLDFAKNTEELGPINDPIPPKPKKKSTSGGGAPFRVCPECNSYNHASARHCEFCYYEFPVMIKYGDEAGTGDLIADGPRNTTKVKAEPQLEVFPVSVVTYTKHQKMGKPDAIKATYQCGLRTFTDYVCIEHGGFATKKAHEWWQKHANGSAPSTTEEALTKVDTLPTPTYITVWVNVKYPEVKGIFFGPEAPKIGSGTQ